MGDKQRRIEALGGGTFSLNNDADAGDPHGTPIPSPNLDALNEDCLVEEST